MTVENQETEELKQLRVLLDRRNRQITAFKELLLKSVIVFSEIGEHIKKIEDME